MLWLFLRVLTSVWAALVSPLYPMTLREQTMPLWPPTAPLGAWVQRVLLDPWLRWDAIYYIDIVEQGYRLDNGSAQFHPLLVWLATPFQWLGAPPMAGLLVVSSLASLLLLLAFDKLARCDLEPATAHTATLLLAFAPPAFVLFTPYTEGLFLLFAVLSFWYARKQSWWLAGLAGALATLTRQQGLFLVLPLAWELWAAARYDWRQALAAWRHWLSLGLIPLAMLLWIAYRALALQDLSPDMSSAHGFIYSVLISPGASKVVPVQAFLFPPHALWLALQSWFTSPSYYVGIDLVLGFAFLVMLVLAWPHMRISYRIYAATIALVSFSYHTGTLLPYMGLPRHLLLAFPVFIGLAPVVQQRPWLRRVAVMVGLPGMLFLLFLYIIQGWVP
jgi:hypothetical protein